MLQLGFEWYLAPEPLTQTISSDTCSGVGSGVGVDVGIGVIVGVGVGVGVAVGSGVGVFVGSGVGVKYASSFLVGSVLFFEELGLNKAQTKTAAEQTNFVLITDIRYSAAVSYFIE